MDLWFSECHAPDVKHSLRVTRHLYSSRSEYQQIDIFETPEFGRVLALDGNVMLTERDEFIYDEMITHIPMSVRPNVEDILVIGAGDGGVVKELTRYDCVKRIDLVEMDGQVIEACRAYLPENASKLDDECIFISTTRFVLSGGVKDEYDLIIVDSNDPFGPSRVFHKRILRNLLQRAARRRNNGESARKSAFTKHDADAMQRSHKRIVNTFP